METGITLAPHAPHYFAASVLDAMNLRLTIQSVAYKTYKANHKIFIVISWLLNSTLCLKQKDWPPHNPKGYSYKVIRKLIKIQVSPSIDAQMVQTQCFDRIAQWITLMIKTIFKLMDTTLQELKLQSIKIRDGVVFSQYSRIIYFVNDLSIF